MQFLLLIYENENVWADMPEAEKGKIFAEYFAFSDGLRKAGQYVAGEALQPTTTATTVRIREGKTLVTDGPFAETREHLGGFYLVEARDIEEARALAARIPAARTGSIEVRPVQKYS